MYSAHREAVRPSIMGVAIAIAVTYAVLFGALGPLGTGVRLSFFVRLYIVGLCMVVDLVTCYGGFLMTLYLMRSRAPLHTALALVPAALIFAMTCTAVAYTGLHLAEPGRRIPISVLPSTYLVFVLVLLSSAAILYYVLHLRLNSLRSAGHREASFPSAYLHNAASSSANRANTGGVQGTAAADDETGMAADAASGEQSRREPQIDLFRRLPSRVGNDILYLEASGHYIKVLTRSGSVVIRMRLTDAVTELGTQGMRIHRSYWAAYGHMTGLQRRDRRMLLCLTGGHELPISRSVISAVRKAIEERTGL